MPKYKINMMHNSTMLTAEVEGSNIATALAKQEKANKGKQLEIVKIEKI